LAINGIQGHIGDKSDADITCFFEKAQRYVNRYGDKAMQRVKSDAASSRIINGIGQKMVEINQGRGCHDRKGGFPVLPEEDANDNGRDDKMKCNLNDRSAPVLKGLLARHSHHGIGWDETG
jgi:hypothetical protein